MIVERVADLDLEVPAWQRRSAPARTLPERSRRDPFGAVSGSRRWKLAGHFAS